jgi:hypothetical protein
MTCRKKQHSAIGAFGAGLLSLGSAKRQPMKAA